MKPNHVLKAIGVWAILTLILELAFGSSQGLTFLDPIALGGAIWAIRPLLKAKVKLLDRATAAVIAALLFKHLSCSVFKMSLPDADPVFALLVSLPVFAFAGTMTFNALKLIKKDEYTDDRKKPKLDFKNDKYPIILDDENQHFIPSAVQAEHVQVIGGSGSGKTVFMKRAMYQIMKSHAGMFVFDAKSDFSKTIAYYATQTGRVSDLRYFDIAEPDRSQTFNPIYGSDPDEVFNKLIIMLFPKKNEENPFYYSVACEVLSNLIPLIIWEVKTATFADLRQILSTEINSFNTLAYLCAKYPETEQAQYFSENWIAKKPEERQKNLAGLNSRINRFCGRKWSNLINCRNPQITIEDVVNNHRIFIFGVSAISNIEDSRSLIIAALLSHGPMIQKRMKEPPAIPHYLMLDEFYNATYPDFVDTINKCRGANVPCFLAHQSLGDLKAVSEPFCSHILDLTRTKVVLPVSGNDTVDYFVKQFGTVRTDQHVYSFTAQNQVAGKTVKPDEHFRFDPNVLKARGHGHCVLLSRWDNQVMAFDAKIDREPKLPGHFNLDAVIPIRNLDKVKLEPLKHQGDDEHQSSGLAQPEPPTSPLAPKGHYPSKPSSQSALLSKIKERNLAEIKRKAGKKEDVNGA